MKDLSGTGHLYAAQNMEGNEAQIIQFIEKEKNEDGVFVTVNDGTTNEEIVKILIDRIEKLNQKFASPFNELTLNSLRLALHAMEARTAERKARGVEGKPLL